MYVIRESNTRHAITLILFSKDGFWAKDERSGIHAPYVRLEPSHADNEVVPRLAPLQSRLSESATGANTNRELPTGRAKSNDDRQPWMISETTGTLFYFGGLRRRTDDS